MEALSFPEATATSSSTSDESFVKTSPASNALLNLNEDNTTPHNHVDPDINENMVSQVADREAQEILNWMKEQEEQEDEQEEKEEEEEEDLYARESQDILASQAEQEQAEQEDYADMEEIIPQYDGANDDPTSPITNQRKNFKVAHTTQTPVVKVSMSVYLFSSI